MESWETLNKLTDEEIIERFNAGRESVVVGKQWWLDELVRRRADKATDALIRLTRVLAVLTVAVLVMTAASTAAVLYDVFWRE